MCFNEEICHHSIMSWMGHAAVACTYRDDDARPIFRPPSAEAPHHRMAEADARGPGEALETSRVRADAVARRGAGRRPNAWRLCHVVRPGLRLRIENFDSLV